MPAAHLAQHWNETPLFVSELDRYRIYPWSLRAAEFQEHRGKRVLEIGGGTVAWRCSTNRPEFSEFVVES
jgi:hypothetical protein